MSKEAELSGVELGDEIRIVETHRVIGIQENGDVLTLRTDVEDSAPYRWIGGKVNRDETVEILSKGECKICGSSNTILRKRATESTGWPEWWEDKQVIECHDCGKYWTE